MSPCLRDGTVESIGKEGEDFWIKVSCLLSGGLLAGHRDWHYNGISRNGGQVLIQFIEINFSIRRALSDVLEQHKAPG